MNTTNYHKTENSIRLNKYIANAGICSRRDADKLIEEGKIRVNGKVITQLGYKVSESDNVQYNNIVLKPERFVYILLNKPKDYITTMDDPEGRNTVMQLIKGATKERVFPVGRLDRNTSGLLLFTNDGELAQQLTHPSYKVQKVYYAELNKPLTEKDVEAIIKGIELEDGIAIVDSINYLETSRTQLGIEIHIGKNRIIRRVFEHLGYDILKLDRVVYAGLTKRNLPRNKWRFLNSKEIGQLKKGLHVRF